MGADSSPTETQEATPKVPWAYLAAAPAGLCAGVAWLAVRCGWVQAIDHLRQLVIFGVLALAFAVPSLWRLVHGARRRSVWRSITILIVLGGWWAVSAPWAAQTLARAQCGAASLKRSTWMRGMHWQISERFNRDGKLPATLAMLLKTGDIDSPCACISQREARAGSFTLHDLLSGRIAAFDYVTAARASGVLTDDWERLGPYVFSRKSAAFEGKSSSMIVAYSHHFQSNRPELHLVFADGRVEWLWGEKVCGDEAQGYVRGALKSPITPPPELLKIVGLDSP